jgi:ppGpp synthetase/RelA/SpoT-type nucleotidyltranferase
MLGVCFLKNDATIHSDVLQNAKSAKMSRVTDRAKTGSSLWQKFSRSQASARLPSPEVLFCNRPSPKQKSKG